MVFLLEHHGWTKNSPPWLHLEHGSQTSGIQARRLYRFGHIWAPHVLLFIFNFFLMSTYFKKMHIKEDVILFMKPLSFILENN